MHKHILLPVLAASVLAGCGGEGNQRAGRCPPVGDAAVAAATEHYVRTVNPRAHRHMVMAGTDSALPEQARRVLQDRGPMYLYPTDTAQQAGLRQRLVETGGWTTLLVVLREVSEPRGSHAEVELGGHYMTGVEGTEPAATMRVPLECVDDAWRVVTDESAERVS